MGAIYALIPKWLVMAVAAALAVGCVILGAQNLWLRADLAITETQLEEAKRDIAVLQTANKKLAEAVDLKNQAIKDWEKKYAEHQAWSKAEVAKADQRADRNHERAETWKARAEQPAPEDQCKAMVDHLDEFLRQQRGAGP